MNPSLQLRALRRAAESRITWLSLADIATMLLSLVIAVCLWVFINTGQRMSERTLRIRLEPRDLPPGLVITNPVRETVEVRVSGAGIILSTIDSKRLTAPLDLSGVRPGAMTYTLGPELLHLPRKVEVARITPSQVIFHIDRITRRTVPIQLQQRGELEAGLRLKDVEITPERVDVTGPSTQLEGLGGIDTEPFNVATLSSGTADRELKLVAPGELLQLVRDRVRVRLTVEPVMGQREFKQMSVDVRSDGRPARVSPERVTLVVRGPERDLDRLELPAGSVYVDARSWSGTAARRVRPQVELPGGYEVVRQDPAEVTVQLTAPPGGGRRARPESGAGAHGRGEGG
jgi:YbbR domain-containing protein